MNRHAWQGDFGAWPTRPEWDWLWGSMFFCPDPLSFPPQDMGGWCHYPLDAVGQENAGTQAPNEYGPAMLFDNNTNPSALCDIWKWNTDAVQTGTVPLIPHWTIAFGLDKRGPNAGTLSVVDITQLLGRRHVFEYDTVSGEFWYQFHTDSRFVGVCSEITNGEPATFVLTSEGFGENRMYACGREVAQRSTGGRPLTAVDLIQVGGVAALKQVDAWDGTICPLVITRHAWTADQAAQWSDDPWGFMRPTDTILPQWRQPWEAIIGDVQVRETVIGDVQNRATVKGDTQARATVKGDSQNRAVVAGDVQSRAAVAGDVALKPRG